MKEFKDYLHLLSKDYIGILANIGIIIAGCFIGGLKGGIAIGASSATLIFVTIGKIMAKKTQKKIDASTEAMRRVIENAHNQNKKLKSNL